VDCSYDGFLPAMKKHVPRRKQLDDTLEIGASVFIKAIDECVHAKPHTVSYKSQRKREI